MQNVQNQEKSFQIETHDLKRLIAYLVNRLHHPGIPVWVVVILKCSELPIGDWLLCLIDLAGNLWVESQFGAVDAQKLYVWPIEDGAKVDSLRNTVGMSPFSDYLKDIEEATGITPIYDSSLTIEELNQMRRAKK